MLIKRKKHSAKFKGKIALEALKNDSTINQISSKFNLHPTQITKWKNQLKTRIEEIFETEKSSKLTKSSGPNECELYEEIGRLKFELDWLKKKIARLD